MLYTRKDNPIFSHIQNRIFDSKDAALDMVNFEWSYFFPRSRINLPFVVPFIFLGDIGETKLIRETSLKKPISGSLRGISILRSGLELPWSQLNIASLKCLVKQEIMVERVESDFQLFDHATEYFNATSSVLHECWCCIETFLGFLRILNVKLWPWRVMTYHGGSHF